MENRERKSIGEEEKKDNMKERKMASGRSGERNRKTIKLRSSSQVTLVIFHGIRLSLQFG